MRLLAPLLVAIAVVLVALLSAVGGSASLLLRVQREAPAWSPDGRKIALVAFRGIDTPLQIDVVNSDGGGLHRLSLPACPPAWHAGCTYVSAYSPAWSPDSRRIVFKCGSDLCIMNADGSGTHLLPNPDAQDRYFPAWSPDGKRIAFSSPGFGIFVIDAAGGHRRRLTPRGMSADEPSWSPDGRAIVFTCRQGYGICVMRLNASKSRVWATAPPGATESAPAWSPDGQRVAFTQTPASSPPGIYVTKLDGRKQRRLTPKTIAARDPTWSPDSEKIAFTGYHYGNPAPEAIYIMNADGSNEHPLVP